MLLWQLRAQAQTRCTLSHRVQGKSTIGTRIPLTSPSSLPWLAAHASGITLVRILVGTHLGVRVGRNKADYREDAESNQIDLSFLIHVHRHVFMLCTARGPAAEPVRSNDIFYNFLPNHTKLFHPHFVPAAAPINSPFRGPILFTRSRPRLLPQTTGPEPAE